MRGIVVEGVAAVGKSSILKRLQDRIAGEDVASSKLFVSEHYTMRPLERHLQDRSLGAETLRAHAQRLLGAFAVFQGILEESHFAPSPGRADAAVTLERFLLTFFAAEPDLLVSYGDEKARDDFRTLAGCNMAQYILTASPGVLRRNVESSLIYRNKAWTTHIEAKGGLAAATDGFVAWQERLVNMADTFADCIPTHYIDAGGGDYQKIADTIFEREYRT